MKPYWLLSAILFLAASASAQDFNTNNGQWSTATDWNPDGVPSGTGTDVTISANCNVSGGSYTIGNLSQVNNNTILNIASTGTLTIGSSTLFDAGTDKNVTYNNAGTLTVAGTLYIYGDLNVDNTLTLNITGTMVVYGDINMDNGGNLAVSGSGTLTVGGNLTGSNNTQITTSGSATIAVTGSISIGGGTSSISGPNGSITAGSCSCGGCGGTCPSTVTPVLLESFEVEGHNDRVTLSWATTMEENFNKFVVERSDDGEVFHEIAEIEGQGRDVYKIRNLYKHADLSPLIGFNYYRLKAVDRDDTYEYFDVRSVRIMATKSVSVFPNPSAGEPLSIATNFNPDEGDRLVILNSIGAVVLELPATSNQIILEKSAGLKPGMYIVCYRGAALKKTVPFVVR